MGIAFKNNLKLKKFKAQKKKKRKMLIRYQ